MLKKLINLIHHLNVNLLKNENQRFNMCMNDFIDLLKIVKRKKLQLLKKKEMNCFVFRKRQSSKENEIT